MHWNNVHGERPHKCGICGKRFLYLKDLQRHVQNVHKVEKYVAEQADGHEVQSTWVECEVTPGNGKELEAAFPSSTPRNASVSDEELDAMPSGRAEGYEILTPPPGYAYKLGPKTGVSDPVPAGTGGFMNQVSVDARPIGAQASNELALEEQDTGVALPTPDVQTPGSIDDEASSYDSPSPVPEASTVGRTISRRTQPTTITDSGERADGKAHGQSVDSPLSILRQPRLRRAGIPCSATQSLHSTTPSHGGIRLRKGLRSPQG
jgi:hypothetical protein